jgi:hypothetical protein
MDSKSDGNLFLGSSPSVTKDRWIAHAKNKLSRGYVLIVGNGRRNANFFKPGKGYEMCAFAVAQQMVREGILEEAGQHALGTRYVLSSDADAKIPPPPPRYDDDDEEDTDDGEVDDSLLKMFANDVEDVEEVEDVEDFEEEEHEDDDEHDA